MKRFVAEILTPDWIRTTCTVEAADYTAAYLEITYKYPLKTTIIELKEI